MDNNDRIEALERLARLHQNGHLTDEEFEQSKEKLLSISDSGSTVLEHSEADDPALEYEECDQGGSGKRTFLKVAAATAVMAIVWFAYFNWPREEDENPQFIVTATALNCRTAPDQSSEVLAQLESGQIVSVSEERDGWSQIESADRPCWAASEFLTLAIENLETETLAGPLEQESTSPWTVTRSVDPLTDDFVHQAQARFRDASNYLIDVQIQCIDNENIVYRFALFNRRNLPANFRNIDYERFAIPFTMRLGSNRAVNYLSYNPEFSNVIQFEAINRTRSSEFEESYASFNNLFQALSALESLAAIPDAYRTANANRAVVRFPLTSGDAILDLDQTDPVLRRVLDPCVSNLRRQAEARQAARQARREQSSNERPFDTDYRPIGGQRTPSARQTAVQPRSASPRGDQQSWFDYPNEAIRNEYEGRVEYRVEVGPDGKANGCEILNSTAHPVLDFATCRGVTARGRFNPAIAADGTPTTDYWDGVANWSLAN